MSADGSGIPVIGFWMSDKKVKKLNISGFKNVCQKRGYDLVRLNLTRSLEQQGPFCVIFHKSTDILVSADEGDAKSQKMLRNLEEYIELHPEVPILDPLDRVRHVLDRYKSYLTLRREPRLSAAKSFIPTSALLTSSDPKANLDALRRAGVKFPFVCKPLVSHGDRAHEMAIIFNEAGIADCRPPAVAQTFINHNAVLFKIYCIGDRYAVVKRPSLKNFYNIENEKTIHFFSSDVSKAGTTSSLNCLDDDDPMRGVTYQKLDEEILAKLVKIVQNVMGLTLIGFDIVIENETAKYGIVDVNVYPSYEGYPDFFEAFIDFLDHKVKERYQHRGQLNSLYGSSHRDGERNCRNHNEVNTTGPS